MKIGVIGDIHLMSNEKYGKYDYKLGMNTRTVTKLDYLKFILDGFIESEVKTVVFLGDIFETLNPSEKLKSNFFSMLSTVLNRGIKVIIITGNHDCNMHSMHTYMTAEALNVTDLYIFESYSRPGTLVFSLYGT